MVISVAIESLVPRLSSSTGSSIYVSSQPELTLLRNAISSVISLIPSKGLCVFCEQDCPSYKVLNKTDSYEIRKLEGGKWAATKVKALL